MLDLRRLSRIQLTAVPRVQVAVGYLALMPNYNLPPGVVIDVEGLEKLPDRPVLFAMNHPDRFNYFPFQYALWRKAARYTATWVKGKYYETPAVAAFMEWTNNLPTVSKGYILTKDFVRTVGRRPTAVEYELLRALVDSAADGDADPQLPAGSIPLELTTTPRDVLGRRFEPDRESYADCVNQLYAQMMRRFVELNEEAVELGLDLLIFPQGTRSVRLLPGHIGMAQIANHLRLPIVPVGCNGSEKLYPSSIPFARPGRVLYRIGDPIAYEDYADLHIRGDFEPFSPRSEATHRETLQALVDRVTLRINDLLDPEYKLDQDQRDGGLQGTTRFV